MYDKSNLSSPSTQTDIFFRNAYGGARDRPSFVDSVLGNIGTPLRVGNEDEDDDYTEGDERTQGTELVRTQISIPAAYDEPGTATQMHNRTTDGAQRITAEIECEDEAPIHPQASGELHV